MKPHCFRSSYLTITPSYLMLFLLFALRLWQSVIHLFLLASAHFAFRIRAQHRSPNDAAHIYCFETLSAFTAANSASNSATRCRSRLISSFKPLTYALLSVISSTAMLSSPIFDTARVPKIGLDESDESYLLLLVCSLPRCAHQLRCFSIRQTRNDAGAVRTPSNSSKHKSNRGRPMRPKVRSQMQFLERVVPRDTNVVHRIHTLVATVMLDWWALCHLYRLLFRG